MQPLDSGLLGHRRMPAATAGGFDNNAVAIKSLRVGAAPRRRSRCIHIVRLNSWEGFPTLESVPTMSSLKQAVRSCQAGNYRDAERRCLDILSAAPEHRDALNLLAEIYTAAGALPLAVDCLVRLTQVNPRDAA